jgi:hypothetical protein
MEWVFVPILFPEGGACSQVFDDSPWGTFGKGAEMLTEIVCLGMPRRHSLRVIRESKSGGLTYTSSSWRARA